MILETIRPWLHSPIVRKYFADSFWMTVVRCLWVLHALTVGILVVRKLGPQDYGTLNYVLAYVGMFSILVTFGLNDLIHRELVAHPENRNRLLGNYFMFRLIMTGLMFLVVGLSLIPMKDPVLRRYCLIILFAYAAWPFDTVGLYFQSYVKNHFCALAGGLTCLLYSGLRLYEVFTSAPLWFYVVTEGVLLFSHPVLLFLLYCVFCESPFHWSFRWKEVFGMFRPAIPLSLTSVVGIIYGRTDLLMLEYYLGPVSVGYYSIATRFTDNWVAFIGIFSGIFATAVISAWRTSEEEYRKQRHRFHFMLFWISIPPVLLSFLFGRPVICFLYGERFLPSVQAFYIYVLSLLFNAVYSAFSCHAVNENRLKTIFAVSALGALLNIPMNMFLIPRFGINGAALSTILSMPVGACLVLLPQKKGRRDIWFAIRSIFTLPSFRLNKTSMSGK